VFLLWQIITFLGILIIADEVRHMFKQILRRFENYQFSKLGNAFNDANAYRRVHGAYFAFEYLC